MKMNKNSLPSYECRNFKDIAKCFEQMHASIFRKIPKTEQRTKNLKAKLESTNYTLETRIT